jgi:hypothetical protein
MVIFGYGNARNNVVSNNETFLYLSENPFVAFLFTFFSRQRYDKSPHFPKLLFASTNKDAAVVGFSENPKKPKTLKTITVKTLGPRN